MVESKHTCGGNSHVSTANKDGHVESSEGSKVGCLVGYFLGGTIANCYIRGAAVSGDSKIGGLIGYGARSATRSFWDIEASGQTTSAAGTGKTAAEMQQLATFLEAGWDFIEETENGTEDLWWILEGQDYPRLWWELEPAGSPSASQ
jgi:hypothetical protein